MAKLEDLILKKDDFKGVSISALTLEDLASLISKHKEAFQQLFEGKTAIPAIAQKFPKFIHSVIACATKEDEKIASQLPAGVQLEILNKIWQLSELDSDTLGNVVAGMLMGMQKIASKLPQ